MLSKKQIIKHRLFPKWLDARDNRLNRLLALAKTYRITHWNYNSIGILSKSVVLHYKGSILNGPIKLITEVHLRHFSNR